MEITKNGMYAITGRPNVGKSTLANMLAGAKIAIVSPKPQTTRNRITAVCTRGACQFIFMDTPGFHKAQNRLGTYMNNIVSESVADVDAILLVVEPEPRVGTPEKLLIEKISASKLPAILVINKTDTVQKDRILEVIAAYSSQYEFNDYLPISAKNGIGGDMILDALEKFALDGPQLFPDSQITDQPEKQIIAEIIREKLLTTLDKEIPHGTAVAVEKFEESENIIDISVTIYCERASHKGIIIGKNGAKLKEIGALARVDIEEFLDSKVFLETWVKVKENWRQSDAQLRNFGYN